MHISVVFFAFLYTKKIKFNIIECGIGLTQKRWGTSRLEKIKIILLDDEAKEFNDIGTFT